MGKTRKRRRLVDAYVFPGFRPLANVRGVFGDPQARIVTLVRRAKKRCATPAAQSIEAITMARAVAFEICPAGTFAFGSIWKCDAWTAVAVAR